MRLVPFIVIIPDTVARQVASIAEERWQRIDPESRRALEELMVQNGWTVEGMVGGGLLRGGLEVSK